MLIIQFIPLNYYFKLICAQLVLLQVVFYWQIVSSPTYFW